MIKQYMMLMLSNDPEKNAFYDFLSKQAELEYLYESEIEPFCRSTTGLTCRRSGTDVFGNPFKADNNLASSGYHVYATEEGLLLIKLRFPEVTFKFQGNTKRC